MRQKAILKWLGIVIISYIIIGIAIGFASAQLIAQQEYQHSAQLIGEIANAHPHLEDALMKGLKESDAHDFATGDRILQKYNYSTNIFWSRNALVMVGVSIALLFIPAALLSVVGYLRCKKKNTRINELTGYLESVNRGRDTLLIRQQDDFSYLEDEIYKTVTELRQSRENALKARQSLADNLADISHQLKTPITSMSLMTQLLTDSCEGEDAVYVERLGRQLVRLETLVSSLLTLSKLDAGTLRLDKKSVDVYTMLACAAEPVGETMYQKNQQIMMQLEPEVHFMGDSAWTAEAFLNIIKNCSEHTPSGGVISICYAQNPLYTEIIVEDSGNGFDKDDLPYLFQRFYKGKAAPKDSVGIGLALAKSIICKQNGTIRAENAAGGGARFVIKFYE